MISDRLSTIVDMQQALQHRYGHDFPAMDGAALIDYIRWNHLALENELHEALGETNWKPWASSPPGFKDRDRYVGELADALHFLLNMFLAAGATAAEIMSAYEHKNVRNHERQDEGYAGTEKCDGPGCKRALDEPAMVQFTVTWPTGERFCSAECEAAGRESIRVPAQGEQEAACAD